MVMNSSHGFESLTKITVQKAFFQGPGRTEWVLSKSLSKFPCMVSLSWWRTEDVPLAMCRLLGIPGWNLAITTWELKPFWIMGINYLPINWLAGFQPSTIPYTLVFPNIAGWKMDPAWTCMSHWTWGFSIAMLVYWRVIYTLKWKLQEWIIPTINFWLQSFESSGIPQTWNPKKPV